MNPTILTNLALSKIGHTLVKALGDTTSKEARLAALHYEPCLREALRAHFWSFAMTTRELVPVNVREYLEVTGPLKVGGKAVAFPRLYRKDSLVDGKVCYEEIPEADSEESVSSAYWDGANAEWVLKHGPLDAEWRRGLDADSPDLVKLRPHSPKHFLETNLEGEDNDLRFEQVDQGRSPVAVEIRTEIDGYSPSLSVTGNVVGIAPAEKARMKVTGSITPASANAIYLFSGNLNSKPFFVSSNSEIFWTGTLWGLRGYGGPYPHPFAYTSTEDVSTPDLVTTWTPNTGVTGSPTINPAASNASQVINALLSHPVITALISVAAAPGNTGTGSIAQLKQTSLSGGITGTPSISVVSPVKELLGWSHAFEIPSDFIKAKALRREGLGCLVDKFAIRRVAGRTCVLCNCDAVSLEYVQYLDEPEVFDPLFVKAFTTLFAAKLARAISGSDDMEARFLQIFETVDLPAARTASGHETDSNENHPLRELLDGTLTPGRGDFFARG